MNEHVIPAKEREVPGKLVPASAIPLPKAKAGFRKHWLIAGLATLLAVAMAGAAWWALAARSPVHYVSAQVTRGAVTRAVTATGTVNPELTIIVGAAVSGVIKELYCDYNTRVTKGQVCAKIDPRPYQTVVDQNKANLAVAKAQLEKDKANLAYTKTALDRYASLLQTHAVS
jgi:HlyD family secretion protein